MTTLYFDNITPIRHRRHDPQTSVDAAKRAERFADSHKGRILAALRNGFSGGMNADEIGEIAGLTVVQVDRRTVELERQGLIRVRKVAGQDVISNGMRVWEIV